MEENRLHNNWLSEPAVTDDTYANRGEHPLDWLARSTVQRAKEARRFLNENIAKLPAENQHDFQHNLKVRWKTAFFELIVLRILQELGATITIEQTTVTGKRPDFTAQFPDTTVIVEATSPVIDSVVGQVLKEHIPLLNFIETQIPEGWSVAVSELPDIGLNDSQKEFKKVVTKMLSLPTSVEGQDRIELIEETKNGKIVLIAWPRKPKWPKLLWEAPVTNWDDTKSKVQEATQKKKKQVRKAGLPILLAIEATGMSSEFEDFDLALFGTGFERYNERHELVEVGFDPNGVFNNNRTEAPTYAAVLAFTPVGFREGPSPVLYRHPRFSGVLPEAILRLEQRIYDPNSNSIQTLPSKISNLIEKLKFVDSAF